MFVNLISHTNNIDVLDKAAAICVDKYDTASYVNFNAAIASGHISILEHVTLTFYVEGVSRALTHQLVRHRLASYAEQSQRYTKIDVEKDWYIIPESINTPALKQIYKDMMSSIEETYIKLLDMGVPKEDARMVLPNATKTKIIITLNLRTLVEIANKRLCYKAQKEITKLISIMVNKAALVFPVVKDIAKPNCLLTVGCKEQKPCNRWVGILT